MQCWTHWLSAEDAAAFLSDGLESDTLNCWAKPET
jgi:hypothetical protein